MEIVLPFLYYSFVSGITPGPANICSFSTAIRMGKNVALRQWRGLFVGYFVVSLLSALLTWAIGTTFGEYVKYLTFIGAAYILWLAVHILLDKGEISESDETDSKNSGLREGTFWFGFLLQVTNVKVIIFCLTVFTGYVLPYTTDPVVLMLVGCVLPFTGPICNLAWLHAGAKLQHFFENHRKALNAAMAASLALCAVFMVI